MYQNVNFWHGDLIEIYIGSNLDPRVNELTCQVAHLVG